MNISSFPKPAAAATPRQPRETVQQFFANYALIETDSFQGFMQAQEPLLSPNLVTRVNNFGTEQAYAGPGGYFASLGDWSKFFKTTPDFGVQVPEQPGADGNWKARLSGTLELTQDGQTRPVPPDGHGWTETFTINAAGQIEQLQVDMNLKTR